LASTNIPEIMGNFLNSPSKPTPDQKDGRAYFNKVFLLKDQK